MITASRLSWLLTPKFGLGPSKQRLHCVCSVLPQKCNAWKKRGDRFVFFLLWRNAARKNNHSRTHFSVRRTQAYTHSHSPIHCSLLFSCIYHWYTLENVSTQKWSRITVKWRAWTPPLYFYCPIQMFAIEIECVKLGKIKWDESFYFHNSELLYPSI